MKRITLLATGLLLMSVTLQAIGAREPRRALLAPIHRANAGVRPAQRPRRNATGCSTTDPNAGETFIGIPSQGNIAAMVGGTVAGGASNEVCDSEGGILAGSANVVDVGAYRSVVGGGYGNVTGLPDAGIGAGQYNLANAGQSFIGAGANNSTNGLESFVGAGDYNAASGNGSAIAGGGFTAANSCGCSTASNRVSGDDSFIGAGDQNSVAALDAFLGAGAYNTISSGGTYGSLIGGRANSVAGQYATVIGGYANTASGAYAIVAGGNSDTASGILTYAAGYHAGATHNGSFVWSDYVGGSALVKDTAVNQYVVRASGGVYLFSNETGTAGVRLSPGSGTWASLSDRSAKTHVAPLDDATILAKVSALPIDAWQYASERGVRHVGPMAQDFYAAFGVGEDDRHITSIDEDGVALAAIKALDAKVKRADEDIRRKDAEISRLRRTFGATEAAIERRLDALEGRSTNRFAKRRS